MSLCSSFQRSIKDIFLIYPREILYECLGSWQVQMAIKFCLQKILTTWCFPCHVCLSAVSKPSATYKHRTRRDFLKIGTPFRLTQSNVPVKEILVTVSAISKGIYYVSLKNIQGYSKDLKPWHILDLLSVPMPCMTQFDPVHVSQSLNSRDVAVWKRCFFLD